VIVAASGIMVEAAPRPPIAERRLEICEHKGLGHPDSLTDGACEAAAVALARAYREAYGAPMHFNVDKGLLVAGRSEPRFGGGEVLERANLVICGRAADSQGRFDVAQVAAEAAREYLARTLRRGAENFRIECQIRRGSANLEAVYADEAPVPTANDTSFGVGFWPYSPLERAVLKAAALLRSSELHAAFPAAGDDFKVMGLRRDGDLALTVALAIVDREVRSAAQYFRAKLALTEFLSARLERASVVVNMLDDPAATDETGLYLTVTGLSAEMGDDGQVGRGNRVNGLITPGRPMSLEAVAGKNPAAHVGKIYNVLANEIARAVCEEMPGILEASVQLVSQIGRPIAAPWAASVQVVSKAPLTVALCAGVEKVAAAHLARTGELTHRLEKDGVSFA
jgi:S-adenosylmethionine synthetase